MRRVSHRDFERLLLAVADLNSSVDRTSLSRRTASAVLELFPDSFIAFDVFTKEKHVEQSWNSDPNRISAAMMNVFHDVWNRNPYENPLTEKLLQADYPRALKISDFASHAEMERTAIHNEFYKPVGIEHMLGIGIKVVPETDMSCAVARSTTDFTERERELLTILSPHLRNAIKNTIAFQKMVERATLLEGLLAERSRGFLSFASDGTILEITDVTEQLLKKYFPDSVTVSSRLPEQLRAWAFESDEALSAMGVPSPFIVDLPESRLSIDYIRTQTPGSRMLLVDEKRKLSPQAFQVLGLTAREAEVLYWIEQGKIDEVIATLLGISVRTVNKHVEHILQKLSVETRTAAVNRVRSSLEDSELIT